MAEPYCLAMVLCDGIHRDAATGKFTLLGTFSTITAAQYPANIHFFVYFAVTDGLGRVAIRLRIVDAKEGLSGERESTEVFSSPPSEMDFSDPLMVFEVAALIQTKLPNEGLYHCELFAGDQLLMSRRLLAVPLNVKEKDNE